jgi:hypothetical protein
LDATSDRKLTPLSRLIALKSLLSKSSAKATMTFFWHGTSISSVPKIPELLLDLLKLIEVEVEVDFDKDEDDSRTTSRRRSRAA